ncbi:hypothetical protein TELCIR_17593 [Teladorsagia circumcincta]|uniref:Uncharacterized protein n=1 Tax=Teladorsagia circumcincta TaxID=45464 RepID=A0A2G9TSD0_TELCI|nr:hypothetical protein TELCIR_17593 [Teladorsagia circumcincta]
MSTPSVEPPAVDVVISPLNDIATSTAAAIGKLSNAEPLTTPTGTGNDLSSMQFLDETTRAKLAEIWGTGKQDQSSQEQAWGNQVLLNNFANLNIRSSTRIPTIPSHPMSNSSSTASTVPRQYNSSSSQPENNMLFNQLAAQLLIQQQGVASAPVPPAQSYYPSPSYTDPAIIGMGHLSTPTTGSGGGGASSVPQKSSYNNPYQVCCLMTIISSAFSFLQSFCQLYV